ncbi:MAG: porin [Parvularcula sp.]
MVPYVTASGRKVAARFLSGVAACAFAVVGISSAQEPQPVEITGQLSIVTGAVDGEVVSDADARLQVVGSTVLENGLEIGAAASVRADGGQPANQFLGGRYSSLLGGGSRGFGPDSADVFVDGAYLFAKGGFGTIHVGQDTGVASRLAVTSPTIFRAVGVNDWRTDLTGLNDVHTVNDFSGQATKISYMPPAGFLGGLIGQLQMGVSYAPELGDCRGSACFNTDSLAFDPAGDLVSLEQTWRDVVEAAVYYQNGFDVGEEPLTIGFSASYIRADEEDRTFAASSALRPLFGDYSAYAVGMNVAFGGVTLGGSVKSTNSGFSNSDDDYLAFDAGVTYETGEWNFMVGYGAAEAGRDAGLLLAPNAQDALIGYGVGRQTQAAQAGVSYVFDQGVTLGAAAQIVDSDKSDALGGPEDAAAIVFESSIKF